MYIHMYTLYHVICIRIHAAYIIFYYIILYDTIVVGVGRRLPLGQPPRSPRAKQSLWSSRWALLVGPSDCDRCNCSRIYIYIYIHVYIYIHMYTHIVDLGSFNTI